jgi:hypothetical protein
VDEPTVDWCCRGNPSEGERRREEEEEEEEDRGRRKGKGSFLSDVPSFQETIVFETSLSDGLV